jgi:radical SAM superfamily enzyme YgiQ (UPF0313 family)
MKYDVVIFSDTPLSFARPFGLYRIANEIRSLGFTAKPIWNFNQLTEKEFLTCVSKFISKQTKILGISATFMNRPFDFTSENFFGINDEVLNFRLRFIKKKFPNIKIIIGGAQIDAADENFLSKYKEVDYFVNGQGEEIIKQLLTSSEIKSTEQYGLKYISDKDYPYKTFNTSINIFTKEDDILPGEALPLEIARGCIFACAFCNYDLLGKKVTDFSRTSDSIRKEIINNYDNFGTRHYYIIDDLINDSFEKISLLEQAVKNLPFEITLSGYNRLDLYWRFPDFAKRLMDIGFKAALFGIETINNASGKIVGKGLGKARTEETLYRLRETWKNNVIIEGSFIVGLPKDNEETAKELEDWLSKLTDDNIFQLINVNPLNLNPFNKKSQMFKNPEKYGYKFNLTNDYKNVRGNFMNYWYKDDYSYRQAIQDADRININIKNKLIYNNTMNSFGLPFYFGLLNNVEEENKFFNCIMNNEVYHQDGLPLPRSNFTIHRQNYMKLLLTSGSIDAIPIFR